jgi:hypothetical protein
MQVSRVAEKKVDSFFKTGIGNFVDVILSPVPQGTCARERLGFFCGIFTLLTSETRETRDKCERSRGWSFTGCTSVTGWSAIGAALVTAH